MSEQTAPPPRWRLTLGIDFEGRHRLQHFRDVAAPDPNQAVEQAIKLATEQSEVEGWALEGEVLPARLFPAEVEVRIQRDGRKARISYDGDELGWRIDRSRNGAMNGITYREGVALFAPHGADEEDRQLFKKALDGDRAAQLALHHQMTNGYREAEK